MERAIIEKIFESRRVINEASFEAGGSRYSSAFGRYSKDGESISRDDYFKAKEKFVASDTAGTSDTHSSEVDNDDMDISSISKIAGSSVKKGKEGPYFYDSGDINSFNKSVSEMTDSFKKKYDSAKTVSISKNQVVTYSEESEYAIVTKFSDKSGKSWLQYKKLSDKDKELISKASSEPEEVIDKDMEDEELVSLAKDGDTKAQETLVKKYERLAYHLSKDLFLPGGDKDDLAQEAMLGLVSAMRDYKPGKNKNFKQFAILAMKRNMQDAIRKANTKKNSPLNQADDYETSVGMQASSDSPEKSYIDKSDKERLVNYIKDNLTDWEKKVLSYYMQNYSYDEIAEKTGKNNKSINNAMNNIRSKLRRYKEMYAESKLIEMIVESLDSDSEELISEARKFLHEESIL